MHIYIKRKFIKQIHQIYILTVLKLPNIYKPFIGQGLGPEIYWNMLNGQPNKLQKIIVPTVGTCNYKLSSSFLTLRIKHIFTIQTKISWKNCQSFCFHIFSIENNGYQLLLEEMVFLANNNDGSNNAGLYVLKPK